MSFEINSYVERQNHFRCHAAERHYMEDLDSRGMLLTIDNVSFDTEQLLLRTFQCDTAWCMRCKKSDGKNKYKGSCCTDLQVDITAEEVARIQELGRLAQKKLKFSKTDPVGKIANRMTKGSFTEVTDQGELAFRHLPSSRCSLSWLAADGRLMCGINSLCYAMDVPLSRFKPDPCLLFPLHYVEHEPGKFFLTLISKETYKWIGADEYVSKLRCLRKPAPGSPPAYAFLRDEIIHCFNADLYERLEEAAVTILNEEPCACDSAEENAG